MNNKFKNQISNGHFYVIATIEINNDDYSHGIPLEYLINKLKRSNKILRKSVSTDTKQLVLGFNNLSLNLVKSRDDENSQEVVIVQGLNSARVDLVLNSTQTDSSILLEKVNVAKAELTCVITESSKIAQKIAVNPLNSEQLDNAFNQTRYPSEVQNMLGNMAGSKERVTIDGEVLSVGGYNFPMYCANGEVTTFNHCEILKILPNGQVIFDISRSKEFSLSEFTQQSVVMVEVNPKALDFSVLAFAFAAKLALDIEVGFSKHVIKQQSKSWLIQIMNRSQVSAEILKKWLEVSQKLEILS